MTFGFTSSYIGCMTVAADKSDKKETVCLSIVRPAPAWQDSLARSASLGRETSPDPALGALRAWSPPWRGRSVRAQAVVTAGVTNRRWRRRSLPATMPLPAGRQALRLASIVRHTASFFSLPAATVMHPPISFSFIFF